MYVLVCVCKLARDYIRSGLRIVYATRACWDNAVGGARRVVGLSLDDPLLEEDTDLGNHASQRGGGSQELFPGIGHVRPPRCPF